MSTAVVHVIVIVVIVFLVLVAIRLAWEIIKRLMGIAVIVLIAVALTKMAGLTMSDVGTSIVHFFGLWK